MYYLDGSCPPDYILRNFLEQCEKHHHTGAIAVHCKAGLGRAGTTVGCFIMKHYGFTASELIAWSRICRPGCIIGPQQHFLKEMEQRMWKAGELYRKRRKEAHAARSGSPYASDGSGNGGALSNAMGGLTVHAPGNTTPTRSSLGAAGAALVGTGSPASPKGQLKGEHRDNSQGDHLRGRRASPKAGEASGGAYGTRGAQRGLFGR